MEEILLRSPVKSLVRFTLVSKSWCFLIFNSPFAKLQFQQASQRSGYIRTQNILLSTPNDLKFLNDSETSFGDEAALVRLDFPTKRPYQRVRILGSCNGLVAIALNDTKNNFFIWNPSTGDYKKLPDPFLSTEANNHRYHFVCGFGYESSSDDYKLFIGKHDEAWDSPIKAQIFSLRNNSWRMIKPSVYIRYRSFDNHRTRHSGSYVNGALHWILRRNYMSYTRPRAILAFDLNREKFNRLLIPNAGGYLLGLGVLEGKLCVTHTNGELWMMEDYGNIASWTRFLIMKGDFYGFYEAFSFSERSVVFMDPYFNHLIMYDAEKRKIKKFQIDNKQVNFEVITYIESLLSPNLYDNLSLDEQQKGNRSVQKRKHMLLS